MSETIVQEVEQKVEAVAAEVKAEVAKVVDAVVPEVKKLVQEISTEEKLFLREVENSYLKATMEVSRLSQTTQRAQQDFTKAVETMVKKYALDPTTWVFDNVKLLFTRK